ncbi:MAG: serine/threonine protein kinase [Rubrobacteraceae bacterium]|nr:serine/threonine protein kinase [Rubrobacteraceae bacterium]
MLKEKTLISERYEIERYLGGGGMGEVYAARDHLLDRRVAVKVLKEPYSRDPSFVARFRQEALAAASLDHPGVVEIYDAPSEGGLPCIVMEYVGGGTLRDLILRRGRLEWREAARITAGVARALAAAHAQGVIHRDVKPQNVLLTPSGAPKLADFGIARAADATRVTAPGTILGSVYYISPEQALGEQTGPKSDLYSLGVTLYEMLTGGVPFEAENPIAVAMMHLREHVTPPSSKNPAVPAELDVILDRLLSKDPAGRHPDAGTLAAELEELVESGGRSGHRHRAIVGRVGTARRRHGARRRPGRRSLRNGAAAFLTLVALTGLTGWWAVAGPGNAGSGSGVRAAAKPTAPQVASFETSGRAHHGGTDSSGKGSARAAASSSARTVAQRTEASSARATGAIAPVSSSPAQRQGRGSDSVGSSRETKRPATSFGSASSQMGNQSSGHAATPVSSGAGQSVSSPGAASQLVKVPNLPNVERIIRQSTSVQRNSFSSQQTRTLVNSSSQKSSAGGMTGGAP